MKTRTWIILSLISFIPFIMLIFCFGSIGISWWINNDISDGYIKFMQGKMNNEFIAICSVICFGCLFIFFTTAMKVFRYSDKIDHLDIAENLYYQKADEMNVFKQKYIDLIETIDENGKTTK